MSTRLPFRLRRTIALTLAGSLMPMATPGMAKKPIETADLSALSLSQLNDRGAAALQAADANSAIALYSELVSRAPRDGGAQSLLALSYHLAGGNRAEAIDLALAGYDLATRIEPGQMWPAAMAGRAAYDQGRYAEASEHFARAATLRPRDARVLGALAAATYMAGDVALAATAADRAIALDNGNDAGMLRLGALANAAAGQPVVARKHLTRLAILSPDAAQAATERMAQIEQTAAVDQPVQAGLETDTGSPAADVETPRQVSVDIAIVLSQNTRRERSGINLLDGLGLQYGVNRIGTTTIREVDGQRAGSDYQRVITASIGIPQLNYSLNLFNRGGQYYSVVARPQLTAFNGEMSEFFVGRTLKVAVNGVNSSQLEQIDIGIEMKVTPIEITPTGTRIRVEAGRSFLTADAAGTFNEALTTFRQKVAATAEIRFGETLLLSGLNEAVDDTTFSKTPILGDAPIVGNLFSQRSKTMRRDAVIVLVTPSRPTALPGRAFARGEQSARLTSLWTQVVDPATNVDVTRARLAQMQMFSRMTRGDVTMPFPSPAQAAGEMLKELVAPWRR